jgi:hypothetical protein
MRQVMIVLLEFYPTWLALPREERRVYAGALQEIMSKYSSAVRVKFYDAEALPGKDYTDFVICETEDIKQYHYMWEEIRDSDTYAKGYMKIKDVIMGLENAYQAYESESLNMSTD